MTCLQKIRTTRRRKNEYATIEDFRRIFGKYQEDLYQLSYLLTGDHAKAEQCFVAGLDDAVKANTVFKEWARSWARRAITRNAIRALRPQPSDADSPTPARALSETSKLRIIRDGHLEIDSVLALEDFERVVFVMTVLERYSDYESALLIGCSIGEVRAARTCALSEIANLVRHDSPYEVPVGCGPHHLPPDPKRPGAGKVAEENARRKASLRVA
jgi:DNA-directed RNA polymerase specialized sigma24 family protein